MFYALCGTYITLSVIDEHVGGGRNSMALIRLIQFEMYPNLLDLMAEI